MDAPTQQEQRPQEREHSSKRWSWKKKLLVGGIAVLVLIIGYFTVPPAYGGLKAMRAESFFNRGQEFFALGQWTNALDRYELAMQMDPDQTRFRGALARASEKISMEQAFRSWLEILRSPNVTSEERQDFTEFVLGLGRLDYASEQIMKLWLFTAVCTAISVRLAAG